MKTPKEKLIELRACEDAREWAADKSWKEIYEQCHRGDWLLWLFKKTNPDDLRLLTLAKARCTNTVRHLMKDERSRNAVDVAEQFGLGNASLEELREAACAYAAYADAACAYAAAAADAACAYAAADAACAYAAAAADAACAYAAYAAADAARKENQQLTANIVRETIPFDKFNF